MINVVQIVPDDRDVRRLYGLGAPFFGSAPTALLDGFAHLGTEVEIHVVACVRKCGLPAPEKLAENTFYHQVLVPGGYRRTFFVEAIRAVRRKIREIDPDIVHGQGTEEYPGLCAAFSGFPNCITIHGNMREVAKKRKYRPLLHMVMAAEFEWLALKKTGAVFCNSSYTHHCVGSLNRNKPRVFNAVRSQFFKQTWKPKEENTLLCVGTVVSYKNQIALIHAFDLLPREASFRLLFAGGASAKDPYARDFLRMVEVRDWCEYLGRLEPAVLQEVLCGASGVVHPTLEDSFGLAVAEAQAAGVPVAASALGGLPDLIEHGKTGLLFNPHDPEDIRQKVSLLLDRNISEMLAHNARVFAEDEYRPEVIARKYVELYRGFVSGNHV